MTPTIKQVREHAERGGLWLHLRIDGFPIIWRLYVENEIVMATRPGDPHVGTVHMQHGDWTPCDQAGNPLPLVDDVAFLRAELERVRSSASQAIATCEHERAGVEAERDAARARAERAEAERDGYLISIRALEHERDEWQGRALRAEHALSSRDGEAR